MFHDLRLAVRGLLRQPGFSTLAVLTLALGIGSTAAIFSVVDHVVLRPMPYPNGDRMAFVWMEAPPAMGGLMITPPLSTADRIAREAASFEAFEYWDGESKVTEGPDGAEPVQVLYVRPTLFTMLGGGTKVGRTLIEGDMKPDAPRVAVISHRLWRSRFGGSRDVLAKDIRLDRDLYRIVGVMRPGFRVPEGSEDVWLPLVPDSKARPASTSVQTLGVVKQGVTIEAATQEIQRFSGEGAGLHGEGFTPKVMEPSSFANPTLRRSALVLSGAVGLLLLIGCVNVAALLLTRNSARSRELAIRRALGASRGRLVRLLLFEALAIAAVAGAAGTLFAMWALEGFVAILPENLASIDTLRVDVRVLVFSAAVSLFTGFLFGLLPAFQGTRQDLTEAMRGDARTGGATRSRHRTRRILTAAEVALALILLIGSGLLVRSFVQLQRVPLGFDLSNTIAISLHLPEARYPDIKARQAFFDRLFEELGSLPGVAGATRATMLPPKGGLMFGQLRIEGVEAGAKIPSMYTGGTVAHNYFDVMRIPVREGRLFGDADAKGAPAVVVINEGMARRLWPGRSPLGHRIASVQGSKTDWATIVGVVGDVKSSGLHSFGEHGDFQIYRSDRQTGFGYGSILLKSTGNPAALAAPLRARVAAIDPLLPLNEVLTGEQRMAKEMASERFNLLLFSLFAGLGLALAGIGIYGVMALYVAQRRHEIGVRLALGASSQAVVRLVLKQSLAMTVAGVVAGALGAAYLTRWMKSLLFEVSPTDPWTFAATIAALLAVAVLSTLLPIRRAVRVSPAVALRLD